MSEETGTIRDEQGRFIPGVSGNLEGRLPDTLEQKLAKKAIRQLVGEYKEKLAQILPELSPVLIAKALGGDMQAIKELHDRVMGKPEQPITGGEEGSLPVLIKIIKDESEKSEATS